MHHGISDRAFLIEEKDKIYNGCDIITNKRKNRHNVMRNTEAKGINLNFAGKWSFLIVDGWLNEKRNDVTNPKIFLFRLTYKPLNFIELGGTRSTMYGGAGRPEYKPWEYPTLLMGL